VGGGGYWRTCATGTREEPGTLTQGAPVFPGSSRLGIGPKTPGWLVQDPTTRPIRDLIPTTRGDLEPTQGGAGTREEPGTLTQGAPVFPGSSRLGIEPKTPGFCDAESVLRAPPQTPRYGLLFLIKLSLSLSLSLSHQARG